VSQTQPRAEGGLAGFGDLYGLLRERLRPSGGVDSFASGALWSLAVNGAGAAVALVVQVYIARTLGESEYGRYVYVLAWMNLAAWVARIDLDACASRFIAAYTATERPGFARGFIRRSHQIVWALASTLAVLGVASLTIARPALEPGIWAAGLAACALMIPTAVILHSAACLQGFKRVVASQAPNLIMRPLVFGGIVVAVAAWVTRSLTAADALLANLAATAVALAVTWRPLSQVRRRTVGEVAPQYETRLWLRTAAGFVFVSLAQLILSTQVDLLVVGSLVSTDDAGTYGVASQLAALVVFGANAVAVLGAPIIAELHATRRIAELERFTRLFGTANLALALPVLLVLAIAGPMILRQFGPTFVEGYSTMLVLAGAQLLVAAIGTQAGYLLTMTGHEVLAGRIVGISAGLNLALTFLLTPMFGVLGTAAATAVAVAARTVLLTSQVRRTLGVRVFRPQRLPRP
jgi:O-antigen/teichoic acid export membrane protein